MARYQLTKDRFGQQELKLIFHNYENQEILIPIEEIVRDLIRKFLREQEINEDN